MKVRLKRYLALLPEGSVVVAADTEAKIVRRGKLKKITSGRTITIVMDSVKIAKGGIDWDGHNYLDPEKCALSDDGRWSEEAMYTLNISASDPKEFGVITYGRGIMRICSSQFNIDVICFPQRAISTVAS